MGPGQAVNYIVRLAGAKAKRRRVWPHMLRHSRGYYLADKDTDLRTMQDYLGHRDPKHTAHYTRVAGYRFEGL
jgi:type 1 fimbriae regulatory protein FimB